MDVPPGDADLVEFWTLLEEDERLLAGKRAAIALGFALLLKFYGQHGRFPRGRADLSDRVVDFVAGQLDVPGRELASYDWSGPTVEGHRAEIREHFGFRPVRVLLVGHHAAVREAFAFAFDNEPDLRIAGQAASLAEARKKLVEVDVAVIDLDLPDGYGGDLIGDLREVNAEAQTLVLALGTTVDRQQVARAVDRGAARVLDESTHLEEVVHCVRRLHAGETLLPATEVVKLLREAARDRDHERADRQAIAGLTPRQRDVLALLAEGLDRHAIAERLHITARTQRNHMANILATLGVHSQVQAVLLALRYGVVEIR